MRRAAIYARFSTDLQNERSVDDQIALCRDYAARNGLAIIETFDDKARSGASTVNRDGLLRMMDRAKEGAFDAVIVESLDRLSRDMEDLAGIHKRLTFRAIEILAVHEGAANTVLVGLRGLVGQLYREDNAKKVRRGMSGVIRSSRHAGGRAYGYTKTAERGRLAIVEDEAATVRRIFDEYLAGSTPRDIAHHLNRERVPAPRGKAWNASTINGNGLRGSGILRNELYVGRLVWNKVRMIKDPDTGKRVSRSNPPEAWQAAEVPALAIVPAELFEAAQRRAAARGRTHPSQQRRARHILSGLLRCSACGSGMSTAGRDRSGRTRVRCSAHIESGTCPDPATFYLDTIERAVLSGLKRELHHPEVMAEWVRTYHAERKRLAGKRDAERAGAERRIAVLGRDIERLVDAIAKGHGDPAILGPRATTLSREKADLEQIQQNSVELRPQVVALHPGALKRYEQQIARLEAVMAKGIDAGDTEHAAAVRDLVEAVTVYRGPRPGSVEVSITGRLNALFGDRAYPNGVRGSVGLMVAEDRYSQSHRHFLCEFRARA